MFEWLENLIPTAVAFKENKQTLGELGLPFKRGQQKIYRNFLKEKNLQPISLQRFGNNLIANEGLAPTPLNNKVLPVYLEALSKAAGQEITAKGFKAEGRTGSSKSDFTGHFEFSVVQPV